MDIKQQYKQGQKIRYWSDKVFGVPVDARVLGVRKGLLRIEANFHGTKWRAAIHPDRVVEPVES